MKMSSLNLYFSADVFLQWECNLVLKFDSKYVFDLHNLQQVPQLLLDHPLVRI